MGDQQNPDGIYVPPGINKRYPLDQQNHYPRTDEFCVTCKKKVNQGRVIDGKIYCDEHGS